MKKVEHKNGVPVAWELFTRGPLDITRHGKNFKLDVTDEKLDSAIDYYEEKGERVPLDSRHYIHHLAKELGVDESEVVKMLPDGVALLGTGNLERRGDGLWFSGVEYKPLAEKLARQGVFEYFSPTIRGLVDGRFRVTSVAIENEPAINHLDSLAAGADDPDDIAEYTVKLDALAASANHKPKEQPSMEELLKTLAGLFGDDSIALGAEGNVPENVAGKIKTRVEGLLAKEKDADDFLKAAGDSLSLGADGKEVTFNSVQGAIMGLNEKGSQYDSMQDRVNTLELAAENNKRDKLIEDGLAAGKLTKAMVDSWVNAEGKPVDSVALGAFLKTAPVVVPLEQLNQEKLPKEDSVALTAEDRKVCADCGISEGDFLKAKKGE